MQLFKIPVLKSVFIITLVKTWLMAVIAFAVTRVDLFMGGTTPYRNIRFIKFCTFLLFSKSSTFTLKSPSKTICLTLVPFFAKRFLKQFSQVSISPFGALYIVLRIIFFHFLFKISMLRYSTTSQFMPKFCSILKDSDSCTNILIPPPLQFFLV